MRIDYFAMIKKVIIQIMYRLFIFINNILYRIMGDKISTRLAHSKIGILVFRLFLGKKETIQIQTSEGLKIQLPLNYFTQSGLKPYSEEEEKTIINLFFSRKKFEYL